MIVNQAGGGTSGGDKYSKTVIGGNVGADYVGTQSGFAVATDIKSDDIVIVRMVGINVIQNYANNQWVFVSSGSFEAIGVFASGSTYYGRIGASASTGTAMDFTLSNGVLTFQPQRDQYNRIVRIGTSNAAYETIILRKE